MYVVINCLGMPFDGNTIKERSLGGSETAAYYMAKEIAAQGHNVTMFTTSHNEGVFDGVTYIHCGQVSDAAPLGMNFHFYAENTPHDVLIIQRMPGAFNRQYASKVNLWWVHDLAIGRNKDVYLQHMWNVDGILTVSEFHKQQWVEVLGINPEIVYPITNGIDLSLYEGGIDSELAFPMSDNKNLLYSSRPERGLEHLVGAGGIMERLWKEDENIHLYVCGYDNTTPQMSEYYNYLWKRCEDLPNVTNIGCLTKQELADVQRQCDLHVYPLPGPEQPDFDEVSCITAMECMAAGLPMVVSKRGAIPETCKNSGCVLVEPDSNGMPNIGLFSDVILDLFSDSKELRVSELKQQQLNAAKKFCWSAPAFRIMRVIVPNVMCRSRESVGSVTTELLRNSDIAALDYQVEGTVPEPLSIEERTINELNVCYDFYHNNDFKNHYDSYYEYEKKRGVDYGPENLSGNSRFEFISNIVSNLPSGSTVLDYGCAHGHYTINLAARFPELNFIGVDITKSNIEKAESWSKDLKLSNVSFFNGCIDGGRIGLFFEGMSTSQDYMDSLEVDFLIAAEVVEHVGDPLELVEGLCSYLKADGTICITTPYGPWEAQGYEQHWPWRAHLHHFDKADITEMYGMHREFRLNTIPAGKSRWGSPLGSFVYTFLKPLDGVEFCKPNYERKLEELVPRTQTLSLCMIVKDGSELLLRCLNSVRDIVNEIVIGVDDTTTDNTDNIIAKFGSDHPWINVRTFPITSPVVQGFDSARNVVIEKATGDWILWLDSDEFMVHPHNVLKYLRNSQYDGFAVQQHHMSIEPLGVLKTDLPVKLFRNRRGIRFFGVVHEHPEKELNAGVGFVSIASDFQISHEGYTTEDIRRGRFDRNLDLLARDREMYPDRTLGKFLWIRDLAQMSMYQLERNGGHVTQEMIKRAEIGIKLWEELLEKGEVRMIIDGMDFYSTLAQLFARDKSFQAGFTFNSSKIDPLNMNASIVVKGTFASKKHVKKLFNAIMENKVSGYFNKYF